MNKIPAQFILILSLLFPLPLLAKTQTVIVPVSLSHDYLQTVLVSKLFNRKGQVFRPVDDNSGCHYLELAKPKITTEGQYIRVEADVEARVGKLFGNNCVLVLNWSGKVQVLESLSVSRGGKVQARVVDSRLLNHSGKPAKMKSRLWEWMKEFVHPQLESVVFDLDPVLKTITEFLPTILPNFSPPDMAELQRSIHVQSTKVQSKGATINFAMRIKPESVKHQPEPALTIAEKTQLLQLLNQLDSFFTVVIKNVAIANKLGDDRDALFDVFLEVRHGIANAVIDSGPQQRDSVRRLFLSTWQQLAPILRKIADQQTKYQSGLNFLSFLAAGDALLVLDRYGDQLGIDLSANGLRRMVRVLLPTVNDPLRYHPGIDLNLRRIFGFDDEEPESLPTTSFDPLSWLIPAAHASASKPLTKTLNELNQMIPSRPVLDEYLPKVRNVLVHVTEKQIKKPKSKLKPQYHDTYRWLVLSAAWKESCWRQFVKRKGQRRPLQSGAGAVGIMQVVPRVWRGFYDSEKLKWDFYYNVGAGAEILLHYMRDYAIRKKEHKQPGGLDNLARATYAAYNAGPRKLNRYRRKNATKRQKRVDRTYYEYYLTIKKGDIYGVKKCY